MKYLHDYIENKLDDLLLEVGSFFAFSEEEFHKQKKQGVIYTKGILGSVLPVEYKEYFYIKLEQIYKEAIEQDKKEHSKEKIILRELENYESFYTGSISSVINKLLEYGYTEKDIEEVYTANKENRI